MKAHTLSLNVSLLMLLAQKSRAGDNAAYQRLKEEIHRLFSEFFDSLPASRRTAYLEYQKLLTQKLIQTADNEEMSVTAEELDNLNMQIADILQEK